MKERSEKVSEIYGLLFDLEREAATKESYIINLIYHLLYDLKNEIKKEN